MVILSTPMGVKGADITPWIYHTQVKKVETKVVPNRPLLDCGAIEIKASLAFQALPLSAPLPPPETCAWYMVMVMVMVQPPLPSGLVWKLRKTAQGRY